MDHNFQNERRIRKFWQLLFPLSEIMFNKVPFYHSWADPQEWESGRRTSRSCSVSICCAPSGRTLNADTIRLASTYEQQISISLVASFKPCQRKAAPVCQISQKLRSIFDHVILKSLGSSTASIVAMACLKIRSLPFEVWTRIS